MLDDQLGGGKGLVELRLRPRAELTADEIGRLGDHHSGRHERAGLSLEELAAGLVVGVAAIRDGKQRTRVDEEHSVLAETLGEKVVRCRAAAARS